jgi:PTH2 family peptidyl-tRNA hydrolase
MKMKEKLTEIIRLKQVIVVRKDLKMGVGKLISQACHACLGASEEVKKHNSKHWVKLGISSSLVVDRGLTQIEPNTPTVLGIGPAEIEVLDKITKHLKLL